MKSKPLVIENDADYAAAKGLLTSLMDARSRAGGARLRALAGSISSYEARISPPHPVKPTDAIRFRKGQRGAA